MEKLLIVLSLGFIYSAQAKNIKQLDTIYANEIMTMALFFPSDIKQGITGSDNFVFTYNREKKQNLGLLKAVKGNPSNLLVITSDGKVYSFILKYAEFIDNPNRFISVQESIGDVKRVLKKVLETDENQNTGMQVNDSQDLLRKSCESLLKLPKEKYFRKKGRGIILSLKNIKYQYDKVFLQFEIENKSEVRFDFDFLKIFKVNGNQKRNASYQEIQLNPIYVYNKPSRVLPNIKVQMVYVVPKFIISRNEKIEARLQELKTTRKVILIWR